jgi:hypothetical protein
LAHLAATPDDPGIRPEVQRVNDGLREEYRQITADLARYDHMRAFGNAGEFGAAALGQLGGGMLSPESWLGAGAKGATWLARVGRSALRQGAISGATDLGVQGLNINAGVRDQWEPQRTGAAFGLGAALGGGVQSIAEAANHVANLSRLSPSEAQRVIADFRSKYLKDLLGNDDGGVVAVSKDGGSTVFGVNSRSRRYTAEDRIAADRLRHNLVRYYRDVTNQDNIGRKPNDAAYHAEATTLLRLAQPYDGSLAGRKLDVHVDKDMCPSCETLLPYIGLELGNPTVTFIDRDGMRLTMQDGKWERNQ